MSSPVLPPWGSKKLWILIQKSEEEERKHHEQLFLSSGSLYGVVLSSVILNTAHLPEQGFLAALSKDWRGKGSNEASSDATMGHNHSFLELNSKDRDGDAAGRATGAASSRFQPSCGLSILLPRLTPIVKWYSWLRDAESSSWTWT